MVTFNHHHPGDQEGPKVIEQFRGTTAEQRCGNKNGKNMVRQPMAEHNTATKMDLGCQCGLFLDVAAWTCEFLVRSGCDARCVPTP